MMDQHFKTVLHSILKGLSRVYIKKNLTHPPFHRHFPLYSKCLTIFFEV